MILLTATAGYIKLLILASKTPAWAVESTSTKVVEAHGKAAAATAEVAEAPTAAKREHGATTFSFLASTKSTAKLFMVIGKTN